MNTKYIVTDENLPLEEQLEGAADIIRRGGLVVFPTETVYGLGASALDADAAKKIYAAKGRPSDNPLIIHIGEPKDAENYCVTSPLYYKLTDLFMPGPLTVIMPKRDVIPSTVTGGLDTVAVRCPKNKTARTLIKLAGVPIAAPSANISGRPSPTSAAHVKEDLDGKVDMIIDGGECEIGLESTIVKIDGDSAILLRPGAVTPEMLSRVVSDLKFDAGIKEKNDIGGAPLAPGMKYKHYAPRAEVYLVKGDDDKALAYLKARLDEDDNTGVICFDEMAKELDGENIVSIGKKDDGAAHAKALFSALRHFDETSVKTIYATSVVPSGIDLATYNRMMKASGYKIIDLDEN